MFDCQTVLFVCTGNYYRSRFAEALFNHHAEARALDWKAQSKGFRTHLAKTALSPDAQDALTRRGIRLHHTRPKPEKLIGEDLVNASLTIMIKESEHRPMLKEHFTAWVDRVRFWEIHDIDVEPPQVALPKLEEKVIALIQSLGGAMPSADIAAPEF